MIRLGPRSNAGASLVSYGRSMNATAGTFTKTDRTLEWAGAVGFLLFAGAQGLQAIVLAGLPPAGDVAARVRFDLSTPNLVMLHLLFAGFCLFPAGYVALFLRGRGQGWGLTGLLWIALFITVELLNRGFELRTVLDWERTWLSSSNEALRATLAARLVVFDEAQASATLLILLCYALGSGALAVALHRRDRWSWLASFALALNALRASLRFGALVLGLGPLGPLSAAIFFPVMIFQYATLGLWLALPPRAPRPEAERRP
jgi:hypothetical protein